MPTHPTAYPQNTVTRTRRSPVQLAALVVGLVFLLVGLLGFVPGVTQDLGSIDGAGHQSDAMLLGVFQVSVLHNVVHLLFGVAGVLLARRADTARSYLLVGGAIYLLLWVYGLVVNHESGANFVPLNDADNWLHLILGAGMIALGLLTNRRVARDDRVADGRR
jgi:hypothetical protein